MALPKEPVKLSTFSGGMAPDLGFVPENIPDTAEQIHNAEVQKDNSLRRRRALLSESNPITFEGSWSSSPAVQYTGLQYRVLEFTNLVGVRKQYLFEVIANKLKIYDVTSVELPAQVYVESLTPIYTKDLFNSLTKDASNFEPHRFHGKRRIHQEDNWIFISGYGILFTAIRYIPNSGAGSFVDIYDDTTRAVNNTSGNQWGFWTRRTFAPNELFSSGDRVSNDGKVYEALKSHSAGASTEPGTGAIWEELWFAQEFPVSSEPAWSAVGSYTGAHTVTFQSTVASALYNQRVWAVLSGEPETVYISQVMRSNVMAYYMFAAGDPERGEDVVATDGGTIHITGAGQIHSLLPFFGGVAVLAENGIWLITGPGGVFSATEHSITKVSEVGTLGRDTAIALDNTLFFIGARGFFQVALHESGQLNLNAIDTSTINSRLTQISEFNMRTSQLAFDKFYNQLLWFVSDDAEESDPKALLATEQNRNQLKESVHCLNVFVYDINRRTWVGTYKLAEGSEYGLTSTFEWEGNLGLNDLVHETPTDDSDSTIVTDDSGDVVFAEHPVATPERDYLFFVMQKAGELVSGSTYKSTYRFGTMEYVPDTKDLLLYNINSRILSHPMTLGSLGITKSAQFLHTAMSRVELGILTAAGVDLNPGDLDLTVGWDWHRPGESSHPKAGVVQSIYHPYRWTQSFNDGSDPKKPIIQEKHRLRGRGIALQLLLTNVNGSDFHIAGWQIDVAATRRR